LGTFTSAALTSISISGFWLVSIIEELFSTVISVKQYGHVS
jgi:hypothetical protein